MASFIDWQTFVIVLVVSLWGCIIVREIRKGR